MFKNDQKLRKHSVPSLQSLLKGKKKLGCVLNFSFLKSGLNQKHNRERSPKLMNILSGLEIFCLLWLI